MELKWIQQAQFCENFDGDAIWMSSSISVILPMLVSHLEMVRMWRDSQCDGIHSLAALIMHCTTRDFQYEWMEVVE